jgi:hypothetical protein
MTLVTGADFDALFTSFKESAFRLEGRDRYYAPDEQERLNRFLAGGGYDVASRRRAAWWQMVRDVTASGRRVERVRVVTEPHGDYTRYALAGAAINIEGGEDVRYMPRDQAKALSLPDHDFWLFDDQVVAWMHFTDDDAFRGAELIDAPDVVAQHVRWRASAWEHATLYRDYIR